VFNRRSLLKLVAALAAVGAARAVMIYGGRPFGRTKTPPPTPVDRSAAWTFFAAGEADTIEAIVDRLIPADALSIGGREAGCAIFLDRQLSGPYGQSTVQYLAGPEARGTPQQGPQATHTIAVGYRKGLAALARHCAAQPGGKAFAELAPATQDALLRGLESGSIPLDGADGVNFFNRLLANTREGYFADPIYGGNKGMAGWKLVGFPGARYDYRDFIGRRGEALGLAPVSLIGGDA